jgi:hypothetical protein
MQVAVNKSQQEAKIEATLDGLCLQLSRLAKLHDLVPTQEVALLLSNVYGNVVKFARSSILYYKRSSIGAASGSCLWIVILTDRRLRSSALRHYQTCEALH